MSAAVPEYRVLRDTREQQGWTFDKRSPCLGTFDATLKTGDYTLEGYESELCVERKGCVAEFAQNVTQDRFVRELKRMEGYAHPYVVLEFTMADLLAFPRGSSVPRSKWASLRVTGPFILKRLTELELAGRTRFVLAGPDGKAYASGLFKRFLESKAARPCTK